jgi:hypothetical protein
MERHWTADFYNSKILFASNFEDVYIGARSMVDGMGLSWGTQYLKMKKKFNCFPIKTVGRDSRFRESIGLHKNFVSDYLETIDPRKVSDEIADYVMMYKNQFADFVESQTSPVQEQRTVDFYLDSSKGVESLVMDAFKLQNQGIIKHFAELFKYIQQNPDSIGDHFKLPDTMLDIAEILAVNQHKLG